jgi:hypothetical protein
LDLRHHAWAVLNGKAIDVTQDGPFIDAARQRWLQPRASVAGSRAALGGHVLIDGGMSDGDGA